jgi:hypothetical protein
VTLHAFFRALLSGDMTVNAKTVHYFVPGLPVMTFSALLDPVIIAVLMMTVNAGKSLFLMYFMRHYHRTNLPFVWRDSILLNTVCGNFGYNHIIGINRITPLNPWI